MSRAQFKKGEIVYYRNGAGEAELAVITNVAADEPAQYNVETFAGEKTVCGESATENGAVYAL